MINKTGSLIMNYQKITASVIVIFMMTINLIAALPPSFENTLNELYDNLLQQEYAGPISFPNHQVERKAQRSPSLRLRFGRSDPDFQSMEKRWFGDVHQKPIRSPSLRLRFGRRSDPMVPIHEFESTDENYDRVRREVDDETLKQIKRKPSLRLRYGRDMRMPLTPSLQTTNELNSELLAGLLQAINEFDYNEMNSDDFIRETRKSAPLRLRWGRSIDSTPLHDTLIDTKPTPTS